MILHVVLTIPMFAHMLRKETMNQELDVDVFLIIRWIHQKIFLLILNKNKDISISND